MKLKEEDDMHVESYLASSFEKIMAAHKVGSFTTAGYTAGGGGWGWGGGGGGWGELSVRRFAEFGC